MYTLLERLCFAILITTSSLSLKKLARVKVMEISSTAGRRIRLHDLLLRILGLAFTLVAAVLVGISKQTYTVSVTIAEGLSILHLPFTAKWHHMSAFVYFLVSNSIACSYAAGSVVYSRINAARSYKHNSAMVLSVLDLIIVPLLFSADGAAAAIGIIGHDGNSHVQWRKVCDVFDGLLPPLRSRDRPVSNWVSKTRTPGD